MKLLISILTLVFLVNTSFASSIDRNESLCIDKECIQVLKSEPVEVYKELSVERVIDGDTLLVAGGLKIRLWGIDAPEKDEPLYKHSALLLEQLIADKEITCKFIEFDRYQRSVMQCSDHTGQDIGAFLVKTGFARDYPKYSGSYYKPEEDLAKKLNLGIWK